MHTDNFIDDMIRGLKDSIIDRDNTISELKLQIDRLNEGIRTGEKERIDLILKLSQTVPYLVDSAASCDEAEEFEFLSKLTDEIRKLRASVPPVTPDNSL